MMKRKSLLCGVLALAGVAVAWAEPVSSDAAASAVRSWVASKARLGCRMGATVSGVRTCSPTNGVSFHVVKLEGGGFVVTSSDTETEPILAFSESGDLVESEKNPLWTLLRRDLSSRGTSARRRGVLAASTANAASIAAEKWARLVPQKSTNGLLRVTQASLGQATLSDIRVAPLLQTKWSQEQDSYYSNLGDPCYNYYTPSNYPCGCVATAGAQIMRYHRFPTDSVTPGTYACQVETDRDWISPFSYYPVYADIELTMQGGVYEWDSMPFVPAEGTTLVQRQAIGKLTSDVGIACLMSYSDDGSGASGYMLARCLPERFGYASAVAACDERLSMSLVRKALVSNLDAKLPVLLGLNGFEGGHAVVADGYGYSLSTFYVHINMGFAGSEDAWYAPPDISDYTAIDLIVYNIYPEGQTNGVICSGRVLSASGSPIVGASVNAAGLTSAVATTDEQGVYAFILAPGSYVVSSAGASQSVTLRANVETEVLDDGRYYVTPKPEVNNVCDLDLVESEESPPEETHTVIFVLGDQGTWTGGGQLSQTVADGAAADVPTFDVAEGWTFAGWSGVFTNVTADVVVTAQYERAGVGGDASWTISYVLGGGVNAAGNPTSYGVCDEIVLDAPTREGYAFIGWEPDDGVIERGSTGDRTFTAKWVEYTDPGSKALSDGGPYQQVVEGYLWSFWIVDGCAFVVSADTNGWYTYERAISPSPRGAVTVPSALGGHPVTQIGSDAFYGCGYLESVTVPASVETIDEYAFGACELLSAVNLPHDSSLASMGYCAFEDCCSLGAFEIPASVREIGEGCFCGCTALSNLAVAAGNGSFAVRNGFLLTADGATLLGRSRTGDVKTLRVPDGVRRIGDFAFEYGECDSIELPSSLREIGFSAFDSCGDIREVVIPQGVAEIDAYAFGWCHSLTNVMFLGDAPTVDARLFYASEDIAVRVSRTSSGWGVAIPGTWMGRPIDYVEAAPTESTAYAITYVMNGGINAAANPDSYVFGEAVTLSDPTRAGYVFAGWQPGGTIAAGSTGDRTFTAQWKIDWAACNSPWTARDKAKAEGKLLFVLSGADWCPWTTVVKDYIDELDSWFTDRFAIYYCNIDTDAYGMSNGCPAYGAFDPKKFKGNWSSGLLSCNSGGVAELVQAVLDEAVSKYFKTDPTPTPTPTPDPDPEPEPVATDVVDTSVANVFDGILTDGDALAGTIQVKLAKGNTKTGLAKLTATITPAGGKKTTASGNFDPEGGTFSATAKDGTALELVIGADGLCGTFGAYDIEGARNLYSSKDDEDKQTVADADKWIGSYALVWEESGEDASGTPRLRGWNILTISIAKKGKVKVSGTLTDGTKVSASAQMIVGAERCCIPVVYSKKTVLLNFCIWLGRGEDAASTGEGASVDAASSSRQSAEITGLDGAIFGKAGNLAGSAAFSLDDAQSLVSGLSSSTTTVLSDYLPDGAEIALSGTKWVVMPDENGKAMKAGKIAVVKTTGEVDTNPKKSKIDGCNVSGLKLTFTAKTGVFKGSFKVYTTVRKDSSKGSTYSVKSVSATVSGVVIDGVGYGTATIKKVGNFAVRIE